jgi:glycosyltransferase involved in cell wall biosynthesis
LDNKSHTKDIVRRVKESVQSCGQHPAVLCYTIGNEIPAPMVRWYGKDKIENFLKLLYKSVKEIDADSLVTYVNYPTTEYLDLSFLDFDCFNVYLETPEKLGTYISRLHNLSGDRPLVLAEIGLDSMRNGEDKQAEILKWQIETIFGKGCAGMFVFAWTDEWWRGGFEIEDWDFGLVDRQRQPKLALLSVAETMHHVPFLTDDFPFISVVVCSYNGSATIRDTMEGLQKLDYPNFEVIVVNDGSTDGLTGIVKEYPVKLITTFNRGLSHARNTGMYAAKGEIIAYIDDDAYPDEHWLHYLAYAYTNTPHGGIGGPNICPDDDGPIAKCVANAPGGPVHVLITDEIAEHIPGCNMSFRKDALMEIGGFDPVYRTAGDDVDVCWRIQQTGRTIGFHPSAVVWHHRRNSLKAYWKQQKGYGRAEALLEDKWPEKYNGFGHLAWSGRIYGNGLTLPIQLKKGKVFHGSWGSALFQSIYEPAQGFISAIPLMPEWYLFVAILGMLSMLSFFWSALLWAIPVFVSALAIVFIQAVISAYQSTSLPPSKKHNLKYILLITALHVVQPMARLYGRIRHGLTPWRKRTTDNKWKISFPLKARQSNIWSEKWRASEEWLVDIENALIKLKTRVKRGGDFDEWDLQTRNGISSISRAIFTIEEHGAGKQLLRMKTWTRPSKSFIISFSFFTALSVFAAVDGALIVSMILSLFPLLFLTEYVLDTSIAMHHFKKTLVMTGEKWNQFETDARIEESIAVEQHIALNPETTILRLKKHPLQKEESSLELAQVNN